METGQADPFAGDRVPDPWVEQRRELVLALLHVPAAQLPKAFVHDSRVDGHLRDAGRERPQHRHERVHRRSPGEAIDEPIRSLHAGRLEGSGVHP